MRKLFFWICLVLITSMHSPTAHAHAGASPYAHAMKVTLTPQEIQLDYQLRIPTRHLHKSIGEETDDVLKDLFYGLKIRANDQLLTMKSLLSPEQSVHRNRAETLYLLQLKGVLPSNIERLHIQNANYLNERSIFATQLWKSPELIIEEASLFEQVDGKWIPKSKSLWSQDENIREFLLELDISSKQKAGTPVLIGGGNPEAHNPPHNKSPLIDALQGDLSPSVILMALGMAIFFGAAHALSPGHGKTLVAGYLVGNRGTIRHAILLGAIVTFAHTFSVVLLGVVALMLTDQLATEVVYPWIELASGLLVLGVGLTLIWRRWSHAHAHEHGHDHHHDHDGAITTSSLWSLGISGGIVPCPTALVVLLTAISLHQVVFGLVLVLAFSLGLGLALVVVACTVVLMGDKIRNRSQESKWIEWLPVASAVFVTLIGITISTKAINSLL